MNKYCTSSNNDSINVKETCGFYTGLSVKKHSLRTSDKNADRDVKVIYDVISYEVQTSDFLHIAIKSIEKP